eukprot:6240338-Amphidinium_carterae.1
MVVLSFVGLGMMWCCACPVDRVLCAAASNIPALLQTIKGLTKKRATHTDCGWKVHLQPQSVQYEA